MLVLLLAFGGLVGYAYYKYQQDNREAEFCYLPDLTLTPDQFAADFEEIHRLVVENYSLYRKKGINMDSLYRAFAPRVSQAREVTEYGLLVQEYVAALGAGHANTCFRTYTA